MSQVAIIGCGVVGAAIAYELSRLSGLRVFLLDEKMPASGATGGALGVLMGAISQKTGGRAWKLRQASLERYETLIPELESLTGLAIPYNRQGIVLLRFDGQDQEKWQKLREIRRSQGWELELWDQSQLRQRCPQIASDRLAGAVYSRGDRQVEPTRLTQALAAGAAKNGADCRFGIKIENINWKPLDGSNLLRCCSIQVGGTPLEVDWLVIAAGLGTTPLTAALGGPVDVRPVLGQAMQVKLDGPLGDSNFQPAITGQDIHLVPLGGGEYWVGATVEFPTDRGEVEAKPQLLEDLRLAAIGFCPDLARGRVVRTWSGKRPRPQGQPAPIIGELPGYSNILLATGHYRNGVLLAPATALEIRAKMESNYEL